MGDLAIGGMHIDNSKQQKFMLLAAAAGIIGLFLALRNKGTAVESPIYTDNSGNTNDTVLGGIAQSLSTINDTVAGVLTDAAKQIYISVAGDNGISLDKSSSTSSSDSSSVDYSSKAKISIPGLSIGGSGSVKWDNSHNNSTSHAFNETAGNSFSETLMVTGINDAAVMDVLNYLENVTGTYDERTKQQNNLISKINKDSSNVYALSILGR